MSIDALYSILVYPKVMFSVVGRCPGVAVLSAVGDMFRRVFHLPIPTLNGDMDIGRGLGYMWPLLTSLNEDYSSVDMLGLTTSCSPPLNLPLHQVHAAISKWTSGGGHLGVEVQKILKI